MRLRVGKFAAALLKLLLIEKQRQPHIFERTSHLIHTSKFALQSNFFELVAHILETDLKGSFLIERFLLLNSDQRLEQMVVVLEFALEVEERLLFCRVAGSLLHFKMHPLQL